MQINSLGGAHADALARMMILTRRAHTVAGRRRTFMRGDAMGPRQMVAFF